MLHLFEFSPGQKAQFWARLYKELRDKGTLVVSQDAARVISPHAIVDYALDGIQMMSKRVGVAGGDR